MQTGTTDGWSLLIGVSRLMSGRQREQAVVVQQEPDGENHQHEQKVHDVPLSARGGGRDRQHAVLPAGQRAELLAQHPGVDFADSTTPSLASFLFAVALVRADDSCLLTTVLPVAPAVLAPIHSIGLGEGERAVSRCLADHLDRFCARRDGHANDQAENDDG
jgi:hypothetical protein